MNLNAPAAISASLPNPGVMALMANSSIQRDLRARFVPAFRTARGMTRSASTIIPIPPDATVEEVSGLEGDSFLCHPASAHLLPAALAAVGEGGVLILDNGGYGLWKSDMYPDDAYIEGFWEWAQPYLTAYQSVHALIPDLVSGSEADNMSLIVDAYIRQSSSVTRCIPVWHPHESDEQLEEIAFMGFDVVAFGASPIYSSPLKSGWNERLARALSIIRGASERAGRHIALHILGTPDASLNSPLGSPAHKLKIEEGCSRHLWNYAHIGTLPYRSPPPF